MTSTPTPENMLAAIQALWPGTCANALWPITIHDANDLECVMLGLLRSEADALIDTPPPLAALADIARGLWLPVSQSEHELTTQIGRDYWLQISSIGWRKAGMANNRKDGIWFVWSRASLCAFLHQLLSAHHLTCASGEPSGASAAPGTDAKGAK